VIGIPAATAVANQISLTTSMSSKVPPVSLGGPVNDGFVFATEAVENVSGMGRHGGGAELDALSGASNFKSLSLPAGGVGLPVPADHSHDALSMSDHHDTANHGITHLLDVMAHHFIIS
jgi:hypothetical protein